MRTLALRSLVVAGAAAVIVLGTAGVALAAPPAALPGNADAAETRWQPAYDYDTDGCYPTPAIGPTGTLNGGLKPSGALNGNCRDQSDLDNTNGYSRYRCDERVVRLRVRAVLREGPGGQRHRERAPARLGARRGVGRERHRPVRVDVGARAASSSAPRARCAWDGTHPRIVYHKDGAGSHAFRLANASDDPPENHYRSWRYPTLVGWNGYPAGIRAVLSAANFGSAVFDLSDARFAGMLRTAMPAGIPFNPDA